MILPNQLTVLRIILTPVFMFFFLVEGPYFKEISLVIFIIAALTDWYDGWLARKFNYITAWGKFWDPMADKILTAGAYFCFIFVGLLPVWMVVLILLRDFLITGFRGYADYKGKSFPTSYYAKAKTTIQMIFLYYMLLFYGLSENEYLGAKYGDVFDSLLHPDLIYWVFFAITVITVHSGLLYIYRNRNVLKELFE